MNSKMKSTMLTVAILWGLGSCAQLPKGATAVTQFDAERYLGQWYEIARFDFRFERNLNNTTANYSLNDDGTVKVVNRGIVKFTITKNFLPSTRAIGEDYVFSDIKYINVTVQELFTKKETTLENIAVKYTEKLDDSGKKISVAVSDSLFRLSAGKYKIKSYTTKNMFGTYLNYNILLNAASVQK